MPSLSTVQRQIAPIPPGRYWIDVIGEQAISDFAAWVRDMSGAVAVEHVEDEEPPALSSTKLQRIAFVIFVVPPGRAPFLNGERFGFPNFAPSEVRSSQDVIRAPHIATPLDDGIIPTLRDAVPDDLVAPLAIGSGLVLLILLVALLPHGSR